MDYSRGIAPELREKRRQRSLLKTEGSGWDIGYGVLYLVSDEAHYLTGALIPVAGGLLMM